MACCLKKTNFASRLEKKNETLPSLRIVGTDRAVGRSVSRIVRCKSQARQEGVKYSVLPGEIGASRRCFHGSTSQPLFRDEAACVLAREAFGAVRPETALGEAVVTRFVDDLVSRAVGEQEVNQIVLVGTGMDTRPYRLPWGPGTMFFEVGPAECLRTSERLLKEAGIRPPKGVLHRRVPAGLQSADGSWYGSLAKAGYRGDRPSIWVVTGLADLDLSTECYDAVLENISSGMMLDSFVVGELPSTIDGDGPVESLASWDVLAMSTRFADAIAEYDIACSEEEASECIKRGVLIRGKQTKLSRHQCRVYSTHTSQLESDADEDYFDNVV